MLNLSIPMKCLTPCFCAGADQSTAEIRPSSIRGALRWWFRAIGGSLHQESMIFGGIDPVRASAVLIRVGDLIERPTGVLPKVGGGHLQPTDPLAYILYYASIAGSENNRATFGQGPRWHEKGSIGAQSTFTLHIRQLRRIGDPEAEILLGKAIESFKHYGSIGLRVTRGLGALQAHGATAESRSSLDEYLTNKGFVIQHTNRSHDDWTSLMRHAGRILQDPLRKIYGAGGNKKPAKATALGNINPTRQSSALHLRPIEANSKLYLSAFEAPHGKVLGNASRNAHSQQILREIHI